LDFKGVGGAKKVGSKASEEQRKMPAKQKRECNQVSASFSPLFLVFSRVHEVNRLKKRIFQFWEYIAACNYAYYTINTSDT
jgi:hypothetical protein